MPWKGWAAPVLPAAWTFLPMFAVERLADYYYLGDNSAAFFTVSGWRLPLFIIVAVAGSVAGGALLRSVRKCALSSTASVFAFLVAVYALCDPRVCYSAGGDGFEPLRLGFFLASVMISGGALGVALRGEKMSKAEHGLAGFFGLAAVCYYPVVFTFAGAGLLAPFDPWAAAGVIAIASLAMSVTLSLDIRERWGFILPLCSLVAVSAVSAGIATSYLASVSASVVSLLTAGTVSAGLGALLVRGRRGSALSHRSSFSLVFALSLVFVLLMMIFAVPDEVAGVVPAQGSFESYVIGTPVYQGAFMVGPPGHADGAGVTVTFNGTTPSTIQSDNYLAAGMGIHAAGCCVDGVDYSYRFDLYLFHSGNEALVASAWEACDDNAACGGHSWKVLMFLHSEEWNGSDVSEPVHLVMTWAQFSPGFGVQWAYSAAGGSSVNFTHFVAPTAENHDFNTGVLPGGTLGPQQSASYFFQFGITSRYPIGHPGWGATFACPSVLTTVWSCVSHAKTIDGSQSFWKVFWRWGEEYTDASVGATGNDTAAFTYSGAGASPNFVELW